ncbi:MAG: DUF3857 domain-containing protein [Bacteroidetes bacterium]|nr:DUF3857 domain-containing protein [Bacteroidota bacterium]
MKYAFYFLSLLFFQTLSAQEDPTEIELKNYDWEINPVRSVITADEAKFEVVYTKDLLVVEYILLGDTLFEYNTLHKKIMLNTDAGVDNFNKVYISTYQGQEVMLLKARSISKDGKVTVFDKSNIKEVENYENAGPYTIFALEGVEVGSEVEYVYTTRVVLTSLNYDSRVFQNSFPVKNSHFELIYPSHLLFTSKSYNGLPEPVLDTTKDGKNKITIDVAYIPAESKDKYSPGKAALQRLEYKYNKNKLNSKGEVHTWDDAAKNYYKSLYEGRDEKIYKKEVKAAKKLLKSLKLKDLPEEEQIRKIEDYIKTNIGITEEDASHYVFDMIKKKSATYFGMARLFAIVLNESGIDHQLVMTCNRMNTPFDGEFQTWHYLQKFLMYFPKYNKYISPIDVLYRYGLVPSDYAYTDGMFVKLIRLGDIKSPVARVGFIDGPDAELNYDNLDMTANFGDDFSTCKLDIKREILGYESVSFQAIVKYLKFDQKEELAGNLLKYAGEDAEVLEHFFGAEKEGDIFKNPFILNGKVQVNSLLEKAGSKYIFNIGNTIGRQEEMYQEKARETDIELDYPHSYLRTIKFTVPEGYVVKNIDDLKMDVFAEEDGKRIMTFTVTYVKEGNTYTVTVEEYYKRIKLPKTQIDIFRKVINAAADFNKKQLILEKQ